MQRVFERAGLQNLFAVLDGDELLVQPLDPLTCKPVGTIEAAPRSECALVINPSRRPATKSEWLAAPWEL